MAHPVQAIEAAGKSMPGFGEQLLGQGQIGFGVGEAAVPYVMF
jgi:hypothetical protein